MRTCNKKICGLIAVFAVVLFSLCAFLLAQPGAAEEVGDGKYHLVTAVSNNTTWGKVEIKGDYRNPDNPNEYRESVTLVATPERGYRFVEWRGNTISGNSKLDVQLTEDKEYSYTAVFEPNTYKISYSDPDVYETLGLDYVNIVQFDGNTPGPTKHTYGNATQLVEPESVEGRYTFKYWKPYLYKDGKLVEVENVVYYPGPDTFELGKAEYFSDIYMVAHYEFADCDVTCIDRAPDGTELGRTVFKLKWGTKNVTGTSAGIGAVTHRGYYYDESCYKNDKPLNKVTDNPKDNVVERYYMPKTYKIDYEYGFEIDGVTGMPAVHTFDLKEDTKTLIPVPPREGWTFTGWTIINWNETDYTYTVIGKDGGIENRVYPNTLPCINGSYYLHGYAYDNAEWTPETKDNFVIRLQANWTPNEYKVQYEDIAKVNEELKYTRLYHEDFILGPVTRVGYTFLGWTLKATEGGEEAKPQLTIQVDASSSVEVLTFVAHWKANEYTVTLNPDVSDPSEMLSPGDGTVKVIFDQPLPDIVPPERKGHIFRGYFAGSNGTAKQYYDAEGHCMADVTWTVAEENVVLYACWIVDTVYVSVNEDLLDAATVYFRVIAEGAEPIRYTGEPIPFDYGTKIEVIVKFQNGYKMVKWQGIMVAHTADYTSQAFTLLEKDTVLEGKYALANVVPELSVDYSREIFTAAEGKIPAGSYILRCGTEELRFEVDENGIVSVTNVPKTEFLSAAAYLGKEVEIIRCGNGTDTADSDPQKLTLAARPVAPVRNEQIDQVNGMDGYIEIIMSAGQVVSQYEFACSPTRVPDGTTGLNWQSEPRFDGLKAGTPYYIYIRIAATENTPHGVSCEVETATLSGKYLQEQINKLKGLANPDDGENVKHLIEVGIAEMNALKPTSDYVEKLDEILNKAMAGMDLARAQDAALAELRKLCRELQESGTYSETGVQSLQICLDSAVEKINAATAADEIRNLTDAAKRDYYAVPVNYLFQGEDTFLTNENGMNYGHRLIISKDPAITSVSAQVQRAIQAGTVKIGAGNTDLSLQQALKALQSLDVAAFYRFQLVYTGSSAAVTPKGPFVIRILLPSDLRSISGMQVAYYNNGTDELVMLKTWVEKDSDATSNRMYLYFETDSIQDFVILGDRNVSLTGAIITLSVIVFCQFVAILFLAICRSKSSGKATAYGVSLPLIALTVRYFPAYSMQLTIALGALAIILQVILIWLLLTTDVVHRRKKQESADVQKVPASSAPEPLYTEEPIEEEPQLTAWQESRMEESYEDVGTEETADETDRATDETSGFEPDDGSDSAELQQGDWYGDNDFIEPAPDPRYSLPDDETTGDTYEYDADDETSGW